MKETAARPQITADSVSFSNQSEGFAILLFIGRDGVADMQS
jgi:hypothetical protein